MASVTYVDESGKLQEVSTYTVVTSSDTEWTSGFYFVNEDVTISHQVTVTGDVKLILADGVTLTVDASASAGDAGIKVILNEAFFTVYGQSAGTGTLTAKGGASGAGIGGAAGQKGRNITIAGGTVNATGGNYAAGIGGGEPLDDGNQVGCKNIKIYNGTVNATGGANAAGIGGGYCVASGEGGNAEYIYIYGGTVNAQGSGSAAGIGGGYCVASKKGGEGRFITIEGGTVNATGGNYAAGIGGGENAAGHDITISGGVVTANGGNAGAGIGGGKNAAGHDITISGGVVTATSGNDAAAIGGGSGGVGYKITISGGDVTATSNENGWCAAGIGGGNGAAGHDITISGGKVTATGERAGAGIGGGNGGTGYNITVSGGTVNASGISGAGIGGGNGQAGSNITISGGKVTATSGSYDWGGTGSAIGGGCNDTASEKIYVTTEQYLAAGTNAASATTVDHTTDNDVTSALAGKTFAGVAPYAKVSYIDEEGKTQTLTSGYRLVTDSAVSTTYTTGYYVVGADYNQDGVIDADDARYASEHSLKTEFSITSNGSAGITVSGDVKIILVDGFSLTCNADAGGAGIRVHNDTPSAEAANQLTVYGQYHNAGSLYALGGWQAAGIGGNNGESGSNVTIAGGYVYAQSCYWGDYAAGIGGGYGGEGSFINITGGTVVAKTGRNGEGGAWGASAAGIGGSYGQAGHDIEISGGVVTANGGTAGAGIGGGEGGAGYNITINGGSVSATGYCGAGIGGGKSGNASDITISGGEIIAQSLSYDSNTPGAGIGGGLNGTAERVYVTNAKSVVAGDSKESCSLPIEHTATTDLAATLNAQHYAAVTTYPTVSFIDENGDVQYIGGDSDVAATYKTISFTGDTTSVTWTDGYYVVGADYNGDGVINADDAALGTSHFSIKGQAVVSGNVKLIIADGFSFEINAEATGAGIRVHNDTPSATAANQFTVYGQTAGTGTLTAIGGWQAAGIGGNRGESGSNITLAGGIVYALGNYWGENAAAIGGGGGDTGYEGSFIKITRGTVVTQQGHEGGGTGANGAGIGGGLNAAGHDIEISGGSVSATGGAEAAGIGGGKGGAGYNITINGGDVSATGGAEAAGVGGGNGATGHDITINGGSVIAAAVSYGAGIGGGNGGAGYKITINGGDVTATTGEWESAGIGGGKGGAGYNITINGGSVSATGGKAGAGIGAGNGAAAHDITINGGTVNAYGISGAGIGGSYGQDGNNITINGGIITAKSGSYQYGGCGSAIGGGVGNTTSYNLTANVDLVIKAGTSSESTTVIEHEAGEDIAEKLRNQYYATSWRETITVTTSKDTTEGQIYQAKSGNAFIVNDGATLNLANDTTFTGNDGAIVNNGTVSVLGAVTLATATDTIANNGTLNWDISAGSATKLDFSISDWSNVSGSGKLTVTVAAEQNTGTYTLAQNVSTAFSVTIGGNTVSVGSGYTDETNNKYYELLLENGTESLRVSDVKSVTTGATTYCAGDNTRISGGTTTKMFIGGTKNPTAETGSCAISISDGSLTKSVATGDAAQGTEANQTGNLDLTIEGGTFGQRVAGGMYTADSTGSTVLNGNVTLTIKGGTFNGRIYGGSNAQQDAYGGQNWIIGNVSTLIDSSKNAIVINNYLIGGSRGAGKIQKDSDGNGGNVTVTFTGLGENLTFGASSVVAGGSNADTVKIYADGSKETSSTVEGARNLVFDAFTGNFGADLRLFSTATFENGTDVTFTDTRVNLWTVETWNFEYGSSLSGLLANDFEGDTINFDVTKWTTADDWTVATGGVKAFDDLDRAQAVYFGDSKATYDLASNSWSDDTYKLALNAEKTAMIVSKIA